MIVDCHTHIFEAGHGGPFDLPCGADDLLRHMDEHGVEHSVVLPLLGVASNEFVQKGCDRSAGRLVPLYNPEFEPATETIKKMETFFSSWSPKGLKIHPRVQGIRVSDGLVGDVLCWADERGLPVLFDVFPFGKSLDDLATHPLAYHAVAQEMPGLKLILAHAGGYKLLEAFMVAKSNPNVYLDLSFTPPYFKNSSLADDCRFVPDRLPPGRILYGSDFPHVRFGESLDNAQRLFADSEEAVRTELFGAAAARLFGISQT
ncbi:MAG: amidohydrolase family protein [Candidatus Sulfotelmatobacter sp.]